MGKPKKKKARRAPAVADRERIEQRRRMRAREELARNEPGGEADHPVVVESPSQVEPRAESRPCPRCGGGLRLLEHGATVVESVPLRFARVVCRACGVERTIWFRLATALTN